MARTENKRLNVPDKKKMRNLTQYKNISDEEYDAVYNRLILGVEVSKEFEKRVESKMAEFQESYELSELTSNDRMMLRALSQALINLEDYEQMSYTVRIGGIDNTNILAMEKLNNVMTNLRRDISKMSDDLMINRSKRDTEKTQSVINFIDDMKRKAKTYYEQKMSYILCPKCHMVLGTIWTQYPLDERNKITLVCGRRYENGTTCGEKVTVRTDEMLKTKGTNVPEALPESMR